MKAYTDLEQSKKLAEILPIESADMRYTPFGDTHPWVWGDNLIEKDSIPCWSLAALLDVMQVDYKIEKTAFDCTADFTYSIWEDYHGISTAEYDELIEACIEMTVKLKERELL